MGEFTTSQKNHQIEKNKDTSELKTHLNFLLQIGRNYDFCTMATQMGTMVNVLCCLCGVSIPPNPANTCPSCLASTADVTRGISTEATLHQCRGCQRWHVDAGKLMACDLESRELMTLCLKNVNGLNKNASSEDKVRLVDACWVWT